MDIRVYLIIAFLVLAIAEAVYLRSKGRGYSMKVAVSNMSCGIWSLCTNLFYAVAFASLYLFVQSRVGIVNSLAWQWWSLAFTFIVVDLCYYAYHRMSHRVSLLWGAHIVHHESDDYNLTVSLRQGSVALIASTPFYLVPALIGVPLTVFLAANAVYQLYQFFVHTALVNNMGWLEHVLATPRLHRVHHARNPEYIDCNYSGFLILWDKLFGSYREPSTEPEYGVTEPLSSWSPAWANFGYFRQLIQKAQSRRGWDKVYTIVAPPEWVPAGEVSKPGSTYRPYDSSPRPEARAIAAGMFVASVGLALLIEDGAEHWQAGPKIAIAVLTAMLAWITTRLFDDRWPTRSQVTLSGVSLRSHRDDA
jgi:sterol desaturase/sphingolipid hydroxylase (fatty acid hydroxylase superfamily)